MGRRIVITGASSEIGVAVCRKIIQKEDKVILQCNRNLEKLEKEMNEVNFSTKIMQVDFRDKNTTDQFCNSIKSFECDILINIAASTKTGLIASISDDDLEEMIQVNNIAVVKIIRAVIPAMVGRHMGCIVNLSSVAASRGNRGQAVYAGTKGFVESLTRSLCAEYAPKGVRINAVAPGPIETGSLKELLNIAPKEVKSSIASNKIGAPKDVANLIAFLCNNESEYINGRIIPIDGGFMRGV